MSADGAAAAVGVKRRGRPGDAEDDDSGSETHLHAPLHADARAHDGDDSATGDNSSSAAASGAQPSSKRPRTEGGAEGAIIEYGRDGKSSAIIVAPPTDPLAARGGRTSDLESPTLLLTGHNAAVLGVAFDGSGKHLASCSKDRTVLLWNVYGEADNYCVLSGHKNAVTDVAWNVGAGGSDVDGVRVYTASADGTAGVWDAESGARVRTLAGHGKCVNAVSAARRGEECLATAGDDGSVRVWDCRSRAPAHTFADRFPLMAVAMSDDGGSVFAAGVDGVIKQWELRRGAPLLRLEGHRDAVTGLALSPDGNTLLSFAMDNTLRAWDVRPFFTAPSAAAAGAAGVGAGPGVSGALPHQGPGISERCIKVRVSCGWGALEIVLLRELDCCG